MSQVPTLVDGVPGSNVPADDRGLLYGDGLFETLGVRDGHVSHWARHMTRLQAGCERLGIPGMDAGLLAAEAARLVTAGAQGVLKLIVTRGSGGRGYREPAVVLPRRILQLHPWPDLPAEAATLGVAVRLCRLRLCHNPLLAGIKHLNRLEQVLARREWDDPRIAEGLLLDGEERLVEGTMSNLFIVREGTLLTPELLRCGVAGVMRSIVLELAQARSVPVEIRPLDRTELLRADEVFLCNSLIGIWPVTAVDGRPYARGPVTALLQQALRNHADGGSGWRP